MRINLINLRKVRISEGKNFNKTKKPLIKRGLLFVAGEGLEPSTFGL